MNDVLSLPYKYCAARLIDNSALFKRPQSMKTMPVTIVSPLKQIIKTRYNAKKL